VSQGGTNDVTPGLYEAAVNIKPKYTEPEKEEYPSNPVEHHLVIAVDVINGNRRKK
jgi:hypothetical protein